MKRLESESYYRNTVEGAKEWAKRHPSIKNAYYTVDDDKIIITKLWITPTKCDVVIVTKNMLKLLSYKELVLSMDSTCKCL